MTVCISGAYGLLVRRNERTQEFLAESREDLARWAARFIALHNDKRDTRTVEDWLAYADDGELMAVSAAMSPQDLEQLIDELRSRGLVRHEDFVVTQSRLGSVDPLPAWLVEVEPCWSYRLRRPED